MKRHLLIAAGIWILLTVVAEAIVINTDFNPVQAAEEAVIIDEAFDFLFILGTPVFTFVVAVLAYSVLRFRSSGDPPQDGVPIHTSRAVTIPWLLITAGLAIFVIFDPGLKGINELRARANAELIVEVTAEQWQWDYSYPQFGIEIVDADELVLPAERPVKFEITSRDVIHSFWIPAFRMKADAVPGLISELYVTPSLIGSFDDDINLRVQCAELCGTGHTRMRTRLRILAPDEFDQWVSDQGQ
jgi:cytochrome c oxidase subunit 2